jgi:hypothetical protein
MTEADRVHSTPRTDSSLHRPTFPPVADSVHAFPAQTAIGQPEGQTLTSDSGKPAGGLSRRPTKWTKEELELARRLLKERKPDSEFRKLLGRSKAHAQRVVLYTPELLNHDRRALDLSIEPRIDVPPHVRADANRRAMAPRTLSAWICGDPAPGQSALDKRRG